MQKHFYSAGRIPAFFLTPIFVFSYPVLAQAQQGAPLPVSIYATQIPGGVPLSQLGSSVTVIGQAEIEQSGATSVADVLRSVPGVSVNQSGGPGQISQVRIRGSEANHLLLIVDGIRFNDPSGFGFDFAGLLAGDVERIEVIRGPQSGLYGSDAHAGVIAVTTKSAKGIKKPVAEGQLEFGSFGTMTGSLFTGVGNGTVWGSISASGTTTNGYNLAGPGGEEDRADIGQVTMRVGAAPVDGLNLDGVLRFGSRLIEYDDTNFFDPLAPALVDAALPNYRQEDIGGRASASYQAPGTNLKHLVSWDGYRFERNAVDAFGPFDSTGTRNQVLYRGSYGFDTPEFAQAHHDVSFQVRREWLDYETTFQPKNNLETTGFAGEWRSALFENLFISAAVRHDMSDFFEDSTTYRLASRYNFNELGVSVHGAVGTGITNPTLDELFGSAGGFVGNAALTPEKSFEWEVGISKNWLEGRVTTGVTYFDGETTNEIRTLFFPVYTSVNDPGVSPRRGGEALLTLAPFAGLLFNANYTYTDARTSTGLEEIRRPPHSGSVDMTWQAAEKVKVRLGAAFNGPIQDDDFRAFPSSRIRLAGYTTVNGQISYALNDNAEAYIRVQNALDDEYEEVFGYRGQPLSAYAGVRVKLAE